MSTETKPSVAAMRAAISIVTEMRRHNIHYMHADVEEEIAAIIDRETGAQGLADAVRIIRVLVYGGRASAIRQIDDVARQALTRFDGGKE